MFPAVRRPSFFQATYCGLLSVFWRFERPSSGGLSVNDEFDRKEDIAEKTGAPFFWHIAPFNRGATMSLIEAKTSVRADAIVERREERHGHSVGCRRLGRRRYVSGRSGRRQRHPEKAA